MNTRMCVRIAVRKRKEQQENEPSVAHSNARQIDDDDEAKCIRSMQPDKWNLPKIFPPERRKKKKLLMATTTPHKQNVIKSKRKRKRKRKGKKVRHTNRTNGLKRRLAVAHPSSRHFALPYSYILHHRSRHHFARFDYYLCPAVWMWLSSEHWPGPFQSYIYIHEAFTCTSQYWLSLILAVPRLHTYTHRIQTRTYYVMR